LLSYTNKKKLINIDLEGDSQKFNKTGYNKLHNLGVSSTTVYEKYERDINKINALIQLEPLSESNQLSLVAQTPTKKHSILRLSLPEMNGKLYKGPP